MDKQKQKAIEHHNAALMDDMDPQAVVNNMFVGLLSLVEKEFIKKSHSTRRDKNRELIFILFRKREELEPFEHFVEALKKTDASHKIIAKAILKTYKQNKGATGFETVSKTSLAGTEETNYGLQIARRSLKDMYLTRFQKVHPFSMPFTLDIENTWVSLTLKDEKDSEATEDHAELLKKAFDKVKTLIIEGDPATGKTSLMRRLAYEWAKGKQELQHYDLVLYAEFRKVREEAFETIVDMVLYYTKTLLKKESFEKLEELMSNEEFRGERRILVLLDGYDEASLEKQCSELEAYFFQSMTDKALLFNLVITTRTGYLSIFNGPQGRFDFAEVLGFTTIEQKDKYIFNHFLSKTEIENRENVAAVHSLLDNNENLNKLAETPLFLTFICLVHERIVDGTLLELYCNITWWLIDRYQKNYPDHNIPSQFEFQANYSDKFETIQEHYLHFPQLHCLGKMALRKKYENVFNPSDCAQFNLQPIIEQVGLLRKEKNYDGSFELATSLFFPHRTIQEFLAAFYCFCSYDPTSNWLLLPGYKLDISKRNEFERFLFRIALSDKMPIPAEKRKYYFKRMTEMRVDMTFDALNTTDGFNNKLLNWFLSQCTNIKEILLTGEVYSTRNQSKMLKDTSVHNESAIASKMSSLTLFSFSDLIKLHLVTFSGCTFSANCQLSFINCPSLKNLEFTACEMKSSTILDIATLPAIDTVVFYECTFEANAQLSLTNCPFLKSLIFTACKMKSSTILDIATLPLIDVMQFSHCTFEADSQLLFANCPFLEYLRFKRCQIDLATWQSITNEIGDSSVRYLKLTFGEDFNKEFLIHLQKCNKVEKMEIKIKNYIVRQSDLLSFCDLIKLHSLNLWRCTFSANSELSFTNCPSLKNLILTGCKMKSSTIVGIATLPAIDTLQFKGCTFEATCQLSFKNCSSLKSLVFLNCEMMGNTFSGIATLPAIDTVDFCGCKIDMAAWQSITDQIRDSSIKCLKLAFWKGDFNTEFLIHLKNCNNVEKIEIHMENCKISQNQPLSFNDLMKLHSLTLRGVSYDSRCTFAANSHLSLTNCPSLKYLTFQWCDMESSTFSGIATLPAVDTVVFYECKIDLATRQSLIDQIRDSSVKCLRVQLKKDINKEFMTLLQKCNNVEKTEITIGYSTIRQNDLLSFSDLINLHSLTFVSCYQSCSFNANSQLFFKGFSSLKRLKFRQCEIERSIQLGIATLPAIDIIKFDKCKIDLATWQLITNEIRDSSVKFLKLTFGKDEWGKGEDFNKELLIHLQKCNNVEKMEIVIWNFNFHHNDLLSFSDLNNLRSLTLVGSILGYRFTCSPQQSFTNCPSLKNLKILNCIIQNNINLDIITLSAIDTVEFYECSFDLATWQLITDQIRNSSVKCLQLSAEFFMEENYPQFLHYLQKCKRVQQIHVKDDYFVAELIHHANYYYLNRYAEEVTANLAQTAQQLPGLMSITILDEHGKTLDECRRLSEMNKERIEKAGQERNPHFSIKYVE